MHAIAIKEHLRFPLVTLSQAYAHTIQAPIGFQKQLDQLTKVSPTLISPKQLYHVKTKWLFLYHSLTHTLYYSKLGSSIPNFQ